MNEFEKLFDGFVTRFGGELVRTTDRPRADYYFPTHRVIAELKTLNNIAVDHHQRKLEPKVAQWMATRRLLCYGTPRVSLQKLRPDLQREWIALLLPPVQELIRSANKQIRETKRDLKLPNAKGLLIVANDKNLLYTSARNYLSVVGRVLLKKDQNGTPAYPEIESVLYLQRQQPWTLLRTRRGGHMEIEQLRDDLASRWNEYLAESEEELGTDGTFAG